MEGAGEWEGRKCVKEREGRDGGRGGARESGMVGEGRGGMEGGGVEKEGERERA